MAEFFPIPGSIFGSVLGASQEERLFGLDEANTLGPAVWFTFAGYSGDYFATIDCKGAQWNAVIRVFSATSCNDYTGYYRGRGYMCDGSPHLVDGLNADEQYYVLVEGASPQGGSVFTLSFREADFDAP